MRSCPPGASLRKSRTSYDESGRPCSRISSASSALVRLEWAVDCFRLDGQLERPHPHEPGRRRIRQRLSDGSLETGIGLPDEEQGDAHAAESTFHDGGIRPFDVRRGSHLLPAQQVGLCARAVELPVQIGDPVLENDPITFRHGRLRSDPDADQDPDDQRQEDSRQRGDVVAEVEHSP